MDHSNLIQPVNGKIAGFRKLRTGMVYRSAAISSAEQMDDLKPAAILDLRTELEASSKPLFVPEGCAYYRISMLSENAPGEDAGVCAEGTSCHERWTDAYSLLLLPIAALRRICNWYALSPRMQTTPTAITLP